MSERNNDLKIGLTSKGRLRGDSERFIRDCGFAYSRSERQAVVNVSTNQGLLIVAFMRPQDIVRKVLAGDLNAGIVGLDTYIEQSPKIGERAEGFVDDNEEEIWTQRLRFGRCRLVLAVDERTFLDSWNYKRYGIKPSPHSLEGKKIATSYPKSVRRYLNYLNISAELEITEGATETQIKMGWVDAIADMVETGQSLRENGLAEIDDIYTSQAIIVANPESMVKTQRSIFDRIWFGVFYQTLKESLRKR